MKVINVNGDDFLNNLEQREIMEALLNGLMESTQEESSKECREDYNKCSDEHNEEECSERVVKSFAEYMYDALNYVPYERNINGKYDFIDMIDEFSNGYKGTFTDGEALYTFDQASKALLVQSEVGVFPASLTSELVNSVFTKKKVLISKEKALELCTSGKEVNYETELFGRKYTGYLTVINGVPKYRINEERDINGNDETILLGAILSGKWYL